MTTLPPAALGAVVAAVITSTLAFVGIMVGKDQKTSEFRQNWIEGLRSDIAEYLASAWSLWREVKHGDSDDGRWNRLREHANKEAMLSTRINLRLNAKEDASIELDVRIKKLVKSIEGWKETSHSEMKEASSGVEKAAQKILKAEWKRVKRGEIGYVVTKFTILAIVVSTLTYSIYAICVSKNAPNPEKRPGSANISITLNPPPPR